MSEHHWHFVAAQVNSTTPIAIAICDRCGVIRTSLVPQPSHERHLGLEGDCPGQPLPREKRGEAPLRAPVA